METKKKYPRIQSKIVKKWKEKYRLNGIEISYNRYQSITTDANGQFTVMLKHDQQFEVFGLPAGTTAVIVEESPGTGFVPAYWDNGVLGDGAVTVADGTTVSVIVVNDYTAAEDSQRQRHG